jgi:hypothetical protein
MTMTDVASPAARAARIAYRALIQGILISGAIVLRSRSSGARPTTWRLTFGRDDVWAARE